MTDLTLRRVEARDLTAILEMVHALARHHGDLPTITRAALARDVLGPHPWLQVLVAQRGGVDGYAAMCPLAQLQYGVRGMDLHHLFVAPHARGEGIGRALIEGAVDLARGQGCRYMTVGTHPDNGAAAAVYRLAGFEDLPPPGPRFRIRW